MRTTTQKNAKKSKTHPPHKKKTLSPLGACYITSLVE